MPVDGRHCCNGVVLDFYTVGRRGYGFFKKELAFLLIGIMILSCTACSGLENLADGLRSGVEQVGDNVAIGKSNAVITPYQSFDGNRTSDNVAFLATYNASVSGFDGQDILVGNTDLKDSDCREIAIHYSFDTISGVCRLVYIDSDLEENVLTENGGGSITVQDRKSVV